MSSASISWNHPSPLRYFETVVSAISLREWLVSRRVVVEVESRRIEANCDEFGEEGYTVPPFDFWLLTECVIKRLPQRRAGSGGERRAEKRARLSQQAALVQQPPEP
eukprot:6213404-Pleurochrysis_carterae.AAC.1